MIDPGWETEKDRTESERIWKNNLRESCAKGFLGKEFYAWSSSD